MLEISFAKDNHEQMMGLFVLHDKNGRNESWSWFYNIGVGGAWWKGVMRDFRNTLNNRNNFLKGTLFFNH